jgi:hypothetical protein
MNKKTLNLKTFILMSNHQSYQQNKNKNVCLKKKIGEGSYGLVFLIENDHVIKIFKNSLVGNTVLDESNYLIPLKNENRELIFFLRYKTNKKEHNFIISLYSIGITKEKLIYNNTIIEKNSYFIILPQCSKFYDTYKIYNKPLIEEKKGIDFTLNVMKRLLDISNFLETKYNCYNLDFKLNNFMFLKNSCNLNDLIMIDFSIIKNKINRYIYNISKKYYIWPNIDNFILENLPSYSVSMNGLELLFGYNKIINSNTPIEFYLDIIYKKNKNVYSLFYNGLNMKVNTEKFIKLINSL